MSEIGEGVAVAVIGDDGATGGAPPDHVIGIALLEQPPSQRTYGYDRETAYPDLPIPHRVHLPSLTLPPSPYWGVRFSAEITYGHEDGTFDDSGSVVFVHIPSGTCSIKFPDFYVAIERVLIALDTTA